MNRAIDCNEHVPTDQCGFDRNASISEDTYVCMCGWRAKDEDDEQSLRLWISDTMSNRGDAALNWR